MAFYLCNTNLATLCLAVIWCDSQRAEKFKDWISLKVSFSKLHTSNCEEQPISHCQINAHTFHAMARNSSYICIYFGLYLKKNQPTLNLQCLQSPKKSLFYSVRPTCLFYTLSSPFYRYGVLSTVAFLFIRCRPAPPLLRCDASRTAPQKWKTAVYLFYKSVQCTNKSL